MTTYKINDDLSFICEGFSNSRNWGHIVVAMYKGREVARKKVFYQNRTWERYTFESAMYLMVDKLDRWYSVTVPLKDRISAYKFVKYGVMQ